MAEDDVIIIDDGLDPDEDTGSEEEYDESSDLSEYDDSVYTDDVILNLFDSTDNDEDDSAEINESDITLNNVETNDLTYYDTMSTDEYDSENHEDDEDDEDADESDESESSEESEDSHIINDNIAVVPTIANVSAGDRVMVVLKNGEPTVVGSAGSGDIFNEALEETTNRVGDIEADNLVVNERLTAAEGDITILNSSKANITDLNASNARIETLETDNATVKGRLTAAEGNITTLTSSKADITDLIASNARIETLETDNTTVKGRLTAAEGNITTLNSLKANITDLDASNARIETLETDNTTVKGRLTAAEGDITTLTSSKADITDLDASNARIETLETDNTTVKGRLTAAEGNITTLTSSKANVADLNAATGRITDLESTRVRTSDLEANYITADVIEATYTKTDFSNTDVAWIQNGVIKDGSISSAMINDVSANKLTAGTINGSVINVTNLNADNITAGTINGQRIGEGSLSLSKLDEDVYTEAEVDAKLSTMQSQIDGAIETWTGTAIPTLQNSPASSWNTTALKDAHVGDVYFVVNSSSQQNGYNYRFTKSGSTYSWQLIKDTDITNALQRISTAEGKITTFDSDISQLKTDTGTLTTKTTSLETRMSDAEDDILDKVDTTTFDEVSDTVDSHSRSISQMSTTLSNKADSSTVSAVTQRVSKNEQDISGINTTIGELQTTIESKADSSTVETMSTKLNTVSNTVDGHTQKITAVENSLETKADSSTVSTLSTKINNVSDTVDGHTQSLQSITQTQTLIQKNAVKSTVQLWFTKADTSAPAKPTAHVTTNNAATGNAWNLAVPTYNGAYPHYYYCYEYQYVDDSYGWSAVTRDIATGEMQERARTAITNAAAADTKAGNAATAASSAQSTADTAVTNAATAQATANKNVKESQQLWFTKANSTAPSKPSAKVTSTAVTGNAWTTKVPTYSSSYPYYFYCMQYIAADGTVTWSDVVYDQATTEAQSVARSTSTNLTTLQQDYATFKQTTQNFESTVGSTYATKTELQTTDDKIENLSIGGRNLLKDSLSIVMIGSDRNFKTDSATPMYKWTYSNADDVHSYSFSAISGATETMNNAYVFVQEYYSPGIEEMRGREYAWSLDIKIDGVANFGDAVRIIFDVDTRPSNPNGLSHIVTLSPGDIVDGTWTHIGASGVVGESDTKSLFEYQIQHLDAVSGPFTISYRRPMVVYGNVVPQDWSPAPEDVDANISAIESRVTTAETSITQNKTDIALRAKSSDVYTKTQVDGKITQEVSDRNSAIEQSASAINLSVSQTYTTKTEFNALEIGGRNLLKYSRDYAKGYGGSTNGDGGIDGTYKQCSVWKYTKRQTSSYEEALTTIASVVSAWTVGPDEDYVLSFWAKASTTLDVHSYFYNFENNTCTKSETSTGYTGVNNSDGNAISTIGTEWDRYWVCWHFGRSTDPAKLRNLIIARMTSAVTGTVWIAGPKLEKGTKATDWTPAPEDMVSQTELESTKSEIKVTTDGITSTVEKISSAKYLVSSSSGSTLANIKTWAAEGYSTTWAVSSGTAANLRVDDTIYLKFSDNTRSCFVYIKGTVTAFTDSSVTMISHGYEDVLPVDTIKSTINQSSDSVKIQANHVDIEGAAIFSSGRLSQTSLNNAYDAKGTADSIQIGGRNFLLNTENPTNSKPPKPIGDEITWGGTSYMTLTYADGVMKLTSNSTSGEHFVRLNTPSHTQRVFEAMGVDPHDSLVLSGFIRASMASSNSRVSVRVQPSNGAAWTTLTFKNLLTGEESANTDQMTILSASSTEWIRFEVCFTISGSLAAVNEYFSFQQYGAFTVGDTIEFKRLKLERGTRATDWTPAPEDVNADISAAENSAKEYYEQIQSQGIQLVTNGNGFMGDNTNWPLLTFDGSKANGSPGSFTKSVGYTGFESSDAFPIDVSKEYLFEFDAMSENGNGRLWSYLGMLDVDGLIIEALSVLYFSGTLTTLAQDLNPGDTTVRLTSAANWASTSADHERALIFWDYKNSYGYTYPTETYSRNYYGSLYADDSKVDKSTGIITLKTAWTGPKKIAGTPVSQGHSGSTHNYAHINVEIPDTWTHYSFIYSGLDLVKNGSDDAHKFRQGTAFAKVGFLWNYGNTSSNPQSQIWVTNISVKEATATKSELNAVSVTANAAAPKTAAVAEEQYIYHSAASGTNSMADTTTWITIATDTQNAWTTKRPTYSSSYPVLFVAKQRKTVSGDVTCTTPIKDDTTTVIDGGHITTGTIDATKVTVANIDATKITSGSISADRIKANVISAVNNGTGTINADKINVSAISIGNLNGYTALSNTIAGKADKRIPDSRNDNQPPSWYIEHYPQQTITEFKFASTIGLSEELYCYLTTVTPWVDSTGGYPKQSTQIGLTKYYRRGNDNSTWSDWIAEETITGAQQKANAAAQTATNYITADAYGIKIHMAGQNTNTYQHQTADSTTFYVNGKKRSTVGADGLHVYVESTETEAASFTADGSEIFVDSNGTSKSLFKVDSTGIRLGANNENRVEISDDGLVIHMTGSSTVDDTTWDNTLLLGQKTIATEGDVIPYAAIENNSAFLHIAHHPDTKYGSEITMSDDGIGLYDYSKVSNTKTENAYVFVGDPIGGIGLYSRMMYSDDVLYPGYLTTTDEDIVTNSVTLSSGTAKNIASITLAKGIWIVDIQVAFASDSSGYRMIQWSASSNTVSDVLNYPIESVAAAPGVKTRLHMSFVIVATSQQTRYLVGRQNSGSSLSAEGRIKITRML